MNSSIRARLWKSTRRRTVVRFMMDSVVQFNEDRPPQMNVPGFSDGIGSAA